MDANKLVKGAQVELETAPGSISISADRAPPARELEITYPLPKEENIVADLTGAYLLGYDLIRISSGTAVPAEDREKIRNSMRWLVGMEIIEEDASHITMQFLLDATTLNPGKILGRMSSIALGMYEDAVQGLVSDRSNLATIPNRDVEVNRQYFLLVRLIRSALVDKRLAGAFHLGNIDVLDYRVAANLLENAGDHIVELAEYVAGSELAEADYKKLHGAVRGFGSIAEKSIEAFAGADRLLAIEAISMHKEFEAELAGLRSMPGKGRQMPVGMLDMVHMFERITRSWADVADLVKPIYNQGPERSRDRTIPG